MNGGALFIVCALCRLLYYLTQPSDAHRLLAKKAMRIDWF
jgi:hypothetical protein